MNLVELRVQVLENVGRDVRGLANPQVERVINRAVEHVTNLVEQTAKNYNMAPAPITVNAVAGTEKYLLGASGVIRKILYVERVPTTGKPTEVRIIPFQQKNDYGGSSSFTDTYRRCRAGAGTFVYIVRESDGEWYLGFPPEASAAMTIKVYYAAPITPLTLGTHIPTEVPENHHELIAVRSTIILLDQHPNIPQNRVQRWERHYGELLQMMQSDLETWNRTGPRVRQMHVSRR